MLHAHIGFMQQLLDLEETLCRRPSLDIAKYSADRFASVSAWKLDESCSAAAAPYSFGEDEPVPLLSLSCLTTQLRHKKQQQQYKRSRGPTCT
jgi:hypothetical protein